MKAIELPIIVHSDQSAELDKLGINADLGLLDTQDYTFYIINAVSSIKERGHEYAVIHSNGTMFYSPLSKKELLKIIADAS